MDQINVLSYNVSGINNSAICNTTQCKDNVTAIINKSITDHGVSLIGLQGSGQLEGIVIPDFEKIIWKKSTSSYAMILYNSKIFNNITDTWFRLNDPPNKHITGNLAEDCGISGILPYQIVLFEHILTRDKLIFTNLHNGSSVTLQDVEINLTKKHEDLKLSNASLAYGIVVGDFNTNVNRQLQLFKGAGWLKYYTLPAGTCCDVTLNGQNMNSSTDHIVTAGFKTGTVETILEASNNFLYSDHLPVVLKLHTNPPVKKIIGYDFDGVLHKNIYNTEESGQRHPDASSFDALKPFDKIITQIKNEIILGHEIHLISANPDTVHKQNFINLHFSDPKYFSKIKIIPPKLGGKNQDILNVSDFYDDSANVLRDFITAYPGTSSTKNLYFVIPELDSYYQVKYLEDVEYYFLILQIILLAIESNKINTISLSNKTEYDNLIGYIRPKLLP